MLIPRHYEYRKGEVLPPQLFDPCHPLPELQAKAKSLSRLCSYMAACAPPSNKESLQDPLVVVTRFGNTRQAVMYALSSHAFQVCLVARPF